MDDDARTKNGARTTSGARGGSDTCHPFEPTTIPLPSHLIQVQTYISGLVVLTADRSLALGPFEERTHQLENIFLPKIFSTTLNNVGHFMTIPYIPLTYSVGTVHKLK